LKEEVGNIKWFSIDAINDLIKNNLFLSPHIEFYKDGMNYIEKINSNN
jgi:hypothetical protein